MQDGATCHMSRRSIALLREIFLNRLISLRGDIFWLARSPDLNSCDFFGYLKVEVFFLEPRDYRQFEGRHSKGRCIDSPF